MKLSRQEFNQAIGNALRAVRVDRGLSQEEAAEGLNAIPEAERRRQDIRIVAVYGTLSVALREQLGLTQKQLAKRSGVPLALL
jgi:transcriptional regulator with XRE-family HTH domain